MRTSSMLGFAALPLLSSAYLEPPPTTAAPDTVSDCSYWQVAADNDTCATIEAYWGITDEQFTSFNPSLANGCAIISGNSYCVERNMGLPTPTPISTPPMSSTTPTPTPSPTTLEGICEDNAGGYSRYCSRCLYHCAQSTDVGQCFYSVFFSVNYNDSQCQQHGGFNCADRAVDVVCPKQ